MNLNSKMAQNAWRAAFDLQNDSLMDAAREIRESHPAMDELINHIKESEKSHTI